MKKRKKDVFSIKLDQEEKEISKGINSAIQKKRLKSSKNLNKELAFARNAAANYLKKDARVTLRLSARDLEGLKQRAAYKGLPYQTFIASVLHEYDEGHFVESV